MVMEYNYLGRSGLRVSNICLGTMTFGREGVRKKLLFHIFNLIKLWLAVSAKKLKSFRMNKLTIYFFFQQTNVASFINIVLYKQVDAALSHQILDRFVALGGNFIDTANVYSRGISETIIGQWLVKYVGFEFYFCCCLSKFLLNYHYYIH